MKKKLFTPVLFLFAMLLNGQTIEKLNYNQTQDINYYKSIKNKTNVVEYTTKNGTVIKLGDTIVLGLPTSSSSTSTGLKYGNTAAYGRGKTTNRSEFSTLTLGKPGGFGNVMMMMGGEEPIKVGADMAAEVTIIKEMITVHKGSKKKPLLVYLLLGEPHGRAFGMNKYISTSDVEKSILVGELVPKNMPMTRDQAISKLKESKELMDLEIITEEEYNKIKAKLTPIITG